MAIAINEIITGNSREKFFQVTKTADADSLATINHHLPFAPEKIYFQPTGAKFYTQQPIVASSTTSVVTILMQTTVGTGDPDPQFVVIIQAPHSIVD